MRVQTPGPKRYSALILSGLAENGEELILAAVMKAAYQIEFNGTGVARMVQVEDSERAAIRLTDEFAKDDETLLVYEADTALRKSKADVVVTGCKTLQPAAFSDPAVELVIDGQAWSTRSWADPASLDADMDRNLFGFEPRTSDSRRTEHKHADFACFHRRGFPFNDANTGTKLPSSRILRIRSSHDGSEDAYTVQLPDLAHSARLRFYCGHGPDVAPRWSKFDLGPMRADTLLLHPEQNTAEILWRCHWRPQRVPLEHHRSVQIRSGGS